MKSTDDKTNKNRSVDVSNDNSSVFDNTNKNKSKNNPKEHPNKICDIDKESDSDSDKSSCHCNPCCYTPGTRYAVIDKNGYYYKK